MDLLATPPYAEYLLTNQPRRRRVLRGLKCQRGRCHLHIDCFLPTCTVSLAKLQLVGITCLFIASKVEEIISPSITNCARGKIPRLSDGMGTDKAEGKMTLCGYASGQTTKRSPRDNC